MERVKIQASLREKLGKETAKKVRFKGNAPAIIYGKGPNLAVEIPVAGLKTLRAIHFSQGAVIDIDLGGQETKENFSVLIKDIQYHPLTEAITHIDFIRVSLEEKIKANVPIVLKGEPKGVKEEGILSQVLWQLTIEALPLDIPEKIEVDVSHLGIGNSVHVKEIKVTENIKIVNSPDETVATVVEKEEEVVATTADEAAPTGPEVIKEKKETEEGEAEGEAKGKEEPKGKEEAKPKEEGKKAPEKGKK
ncbi:MAG: 50S ribosomal protein L25 [Candidatus Omnitrophota bacterium]